MERVKPQCTSEELSALATSPLMLSVLVLTYHGKSVPTIPQQRKDLERQVWDHYVRRMLAEKGATHPGSGDTLQKRYLPETSRSWLTWLAWQMRTHNQTWFYGEALEESWIPTALSRMDRWVLTVLPAVLLGAAATILIAQMLFADFVPFDLTQQGLLGGFLGWYASLQWHIGNVPSLLDMRKKHFARLLPALPLGLLLAGSFWIWLPYFSVQVQDKLQDGIILGGIFGSCSWFLQRKLGRFSASVASSSSPRLAKWSQFTTWLRTRPLHQAIWTGIVLGIGYMLSHGWLRYGLGIYGPLIVEPIGRSNDWLINGLICLINGPAYGLTFGLSFWFLSFLLRGQETSGQLAERVHWNWRALIQWSHLWWSLLIALVACCFFGLSYGLSVGLSYGPSIGLSYGLGDGLGNGLTFGLGYWILLGLYRGLRQEHLEEYDRRKFNQGIRRSFVNTLLLSLLSAGVLAGVAGTLGVGLIYGLIYGLTYGLSKGLIYGLTYGLSKGLSVAWLLALCGWLVVWAATGGLTILHHYTLRFLLARRHAFPLDARHFLDDAVARVLLKRQGGGYGFIHRRLLDFFADAVTSTATNHAGSEQTQPASSTSQSASGEADREGM